MMAVFKRAGPSWTQIALVVPLIESCILGCYFHSMGELWGFKVALRSLLRRFVYRLIKRDLEKQAPGVKVVLPEDEKQGPKEKQMPRDGEK